MAKYLHRSLFPVSWLLLCLLLVQQVGAQCPQRFRDSVFPKLQTTPNIKYGINKLNTDGTRTWQAFDLYEPKDDTLSLRPWIVLIHGGAFTNWPPLDRTSPEIVQLSMDLAKRGYVVISPEYRLFSGDATYQKMAETIIASAFDINDLMCFLSNSVATGNPYRLDKAKFFMGGSSSGALIALNFGLYINDTSDLNAELRQSLNTVAAFDNVNAQTLLQNKFCGIQPKGIIGISAAIIDTNFIQPRSGNVLLIHGKLDGAIPYMSGYPLGNPALPKVYGPGVYLDRMRRSGLQVEADIYDNKYHVPVLFPFGDNLALALQQTLQTGSIFDVPVLDSTERHIANFCYAILGSPVSNCITTGIKQNVITGQLQISPNPSSGAFTLELPSSSRNKKVRLLVYDVTGAVVYQENIISSGTYTLHLNQQPKGVYWLSLSDDSEEETSVYIDKLVLQ